MVTDLELGWLAGIFEGEGSARIYRRKTGSLGYWVQIQAVTNTDFTVVNRVANVLSKLGVAFSLRTKNGNERKKSYYSNCGDIRILRNKDCIKFLETVLPLLGGQKKHQAELILAFFNLTSRAWSGGRGVRKPQRLLDEEAEFYNKQTFRPKATDQPVMSKVN